MVLLVISALRRSGLQAFFAMLLFASLGAWGCGYRTRSTVQREHLETLRPSAILGQTETSTQVARHRLRVHVDVDHAAQVPEFEARFRAQLERVNRTLRAALGIELELVELRTGWTWRLEDPGLDAALLALTRHDPAADVDWVLGLVAPLPLTTPVYHELGRAFSPGRHIVIRGMDDPEELGAIERQADALPRREVLAIYRARREHRETAVLLHELAHSLGALHVEAEGTLMSASHSMSSTRFASETVERMRAGLQNRPPAGTTLAEEGSEDQRAQRFLDRGRPEDAIAILEPLAAAKLASPRGWVILCEASAADARSRMPTQALCNEAALAAKTSPVPPLVLARLSLGAGEFERAIEQADHALSLMESEAETSPHGAALASVFRGLFDLVGAERALSVAEESTARDRVAEWASGARSRLSTLGVPDRREDPELRRFIRQYLAAEEQFGLGAYAECVRILRGVGRKWREEPALIQLECSALSRSGRPLDARAVCRRGLARHDDDPNLMLGLARVEAALGGLGRAVELLERAVEHAPEGHEAFSLLVALYRSMGREQSVKVLASLHLRRFGRPLP